MNTAPTQFDIYVALGDFLSAVTGNEVVRGQINRVPMPDGPDFIVMQSVGRSAVATTVREYDVGAQEQEMGLSTTLTFQVDCYGPEAAEAAQTIVTTFRSLWGVEQFKAAGVSPLHCTDPQQMPVIAGEQQWIQRWMIQCAFHGTIALSVPQQFADTLITGLTEITHGI